MLLVNRDCIDFMAELENGSVDLVVTDPPYGKAIKMNRRKNKDKLCEMITNDDSLDIVRRCIPELYRILKPDSAMFMFMSPNKIAEVEPWLIDAGFKIKNRIVWDKMNHGVGDLQGAFGSQWEVAFLAVKGRPLIRGKRFNDIWQFPRIASQKMLHMNQKPVELLERMILSFSDENNLVFDPFMGSGSTGEACRNTNRRFIGCEIDPYYIKVAGNRLVDK